MKNSLTLLLAFAFGSGAFAQSAPTMAAPTPTDPSADVISMFSDAYTDVPVDTWLTPWSAASLLDTTIMGDATKKYTGVNFLGIETVANQIDATGMNTFHFDAWSPDMTELRVKLVDFGPDGAFQGGDDTEHELAFANPAQGQWVEYDIPLSSFAGLVNTGNIAQLIFAGQPAGAGTVFIDNIYFSFQQGQTGPAVPTTAAPTPTEAAADVISMFSDAYTDVPVDTWQTPWSAAALTDTSADGNATKWYAGLNFVGIETVTNQIDASSMQFFHFDAWTPDATEIRVKIVDFGPDGAFQGGDDTEHEITFTTPAQEQWNEYDIPMGDFVNLTTTSNIAQLIFAAQPAGSANVHIDNIYFSNPPVNYPATAAPTPTDAAADVISMFSDAYTDVPVDTWATVWSAATLKDTLAGGDPIKCYTNLNFVGIETVANQIDASGMTHFHFDAWTPDATEIRVKLVDFGPDGGFQGGDDTEHEITFANPAQGTWNEYDIPLTDFAGLTNTANIAQLIFAAQPAGTAAVYIDNVYFSDQGTVPADPYPMSAAPTPTDAAADVISMFSDAYTDVPVDTWQTPWSQGVLKDTVAAGDPIKCYTGLNFVGIETVANQIDASGMNTFHFDAWTHNATEIRVKLVDFGPDGAFQGGDDTEHEIIYANPTLEQWLEFDIPLADFAGLTTTSNIAQLIFAAQPAGSATVYFDNVYFSNQSIVQPDPYPATAAPTPTHPAADVISMFSDAYTDVPVDTWQTPWSQGVLKDTVAAGDPIKCYTGLNFVGIETVSNQIDASSMTHFTFDAWTADATEIRVKLVDFGPDGAFQGGDDTEHEIVIPTPALQQWNEYDFALTDFVNLTTTSNIAQLIFAAQPAGSATVYFDNVYFRAEAQNYPLTAAPAPTDDPADVISMFSDVYTDVPVDTWATVWSAATLKDTLAGGDPIKCYTNLNFVGIETVANQIDASGMTHFHFDAWTPDATEIRVKLVDFGPDGGFQGGDDTEHEITFANPAQGTWNEYDIPLADFAGLTTTANIAQLIFAAQPAGTAAVYIDNVYFSDQGTVPAVPYPMMAAPTPTTPAADVISMFSDAYNDVPVDTWQTPWSQGVLKDTVAAGDPIKCYTGLNFVGIETVSNQIDASGMDTFHFDAWTHNATELRVKLVDFGPDGAFQGGDDTEHELVFASPALEQWVEFDIPLADFVGLTNTANIAQLIFAAQPAGTATVYFDNVYFSGQPVTGPCSDVLLDIETDANGSETSWEIVAAGSSTAICSGSGYPNNAMVTEICCLTDGCYELRVFDSMGDGIAAPGGYVLSDANGNRIIDNEGDGADGGSLSAIANNGSFCLPLGGDKLSFQSCDDENFQFGDILIAQANPAVSQEFGGANASTSGFQYWFFDPDGSYSRRIFKSHATIQTGIASSSYAYTQLRVFQWSVLPIPADVLLNVRVRSRIAGVNGEWGSACRFMLPTTPNTCPETKLISDPSNPKFSCGVTKDFNAGNYIYAAPILGANKYQFEFALPAEGFLRRIASLNYARRLYWGAGPLEAGKTYEVRVRASFDNGANYCDWGDACDVTIVNAVAPASVAQRSFEEVSEPVFGFWPNPNRGDNLNVALSNLGNQVDRVDLVLFNMFGAQVQSMTLPVVDGQVNTSIQLVDGLAAGMYTISAIAGETRVVERLMIKD